MGDGIRITIVGTGIVGASIGLALKEVAPEMEITGHDKDHGRAKLSAKQGAVDRTEWNLISACERADITILAVPLDGVQEVLVRAGPYFKPDSLVMDTATVKSPILRLADENLRPGANFVGGDPLLLHASAAPAAELLKGTTFCLCPSVSAAPDAVGRASDLVAGIGAKPYFIDPVEHDGLVGAVVHLPLALGLSLLQTSSKSTAWREMVSMGGWRFGSATESILGGPEGHREVFLANHTAIIRWLDIMSDQLNEVRAMLASSDGEALGKAFEAALAAREEWERGDASPTQEAPQYDRGFRNMFLGRL
jgi:prephenate dehydrogenase